MSSGFYNGVLLGNNISKTYFCVIYKQKKYGASNIGNKEDIEIKKLKNVNNQNLENCWV